jgi:hypothetical protein
MSDDDLALAQFVAAATYGQLAGYSLAAGMVGMSPDVSVAEELARLSAREYEEYRILREHLDELTDLPEGLLARQRPVFDEFFDGAIDHGWDHACAALAFGWSIANDFLTMMSPRLPEQTRDVIARVTTHQDIEEFALAQLREVVASEEDRERMRGIVSELLGKALAGYQRAMQDTDALAVLLEDHDEPDVATRQLAIDILANHRRRLAELGIDDPD